MTDREESNSETVDAFKLEKARLMETGFSAFQAGDWALAAESWSEFLVGVLRPELGELRGLIGSAYLKCGHPDRAIEPLTRAVRELPQDTGHWENLGAAYIRTERWDDALAAIRSLLELEPGDAAAWSNQGLVERKLGREAEARKSFVAATRLDPKWAPAWRNLGNSHRDAQQWGEAEVAYRAALDLEPGRTDIWQDLGFVLWKAGEPKNATDAFRKAVETGPKDGDAWFNLAGDCIRQGRWRELRFAYQSLKPLDASNARKICENFAAVPGVNLPGASDPEFWDQELSKPRLYHGLT